MDANTTFTDEQWNKLVQGVAEAFDDLTLKRGFQYERMGSVQQLSLSEERRLEAEVKEGADLCRVELGLDFPGGGSCGCRDRKPCRHQAAALMKLARLRGRPVSALANATASVAKTKRAADETAKDSASESVIMQHSDETENAEHQTQSNNQSMPPDFLSDDDSLSAPNRKPGVEEAALLAASGISAWNRRFEQAAASLTGRTRNPKFAELTLDLVFGEMPPFQPDIEALYRLNAHLFVLRTMSTPAGSGLSSPGYFAHLAVSDTVAGMEAVLSKTLADRENPLVQERLGETLHFVRRQMLTEGREQDMFGTCYYRLLTRWVAPEIGEGETTEAAPNGERVENTIEALDLFAAAESDGDEKAEGFRSEPQTVDPEEVRRLAKKRADFYESELQYLMDEERELGRSLNRQAWLGANAWSRFCLRQDAQARTRLGEAADKPYFSPKKLPDFLSPLARAGEWERLADWLETFGPLLERARANLSDYGLLWDKAIAHLPDAEPRMWASLRDMLPHASSLYEAKLLERSNWDEWMDYQLSTGAEPSSFKVADLAPIEKNAPELLLPFYHQAAERLVEQRSRDGYKGAVRLLKRLEKLYKKMKREDRWDAFMESFNARYGRLRALQEELRKGKLML